MPELASGLTPRETVETLLALEEDEALEAALAAAPPALAARAVSAAPTLAAKTRLLWAMEDRQRRDVLEAVPPALVGVLVQNLEDDNRYLLGDLSCEQFEALLDLCSPERRFYWIATALSFTDARANALPLLLPTRELVELFLTRPGFEEHLRQIGDYAVEDLRIPPEMLLNPPQALIDFFGNENFLRLFPLQDEELARVVQLILDFNPDRYVDIIREGLRGSDYVENHPLEWETLTEDPVLLERLDRTGSQSESQPIERESRDPYGPPLALVPVSASRLVRLAAGLTPAVRAQVSEELQYLFIRQAVAEGGSFLLSDLRRVGRSVEAYLLLGLEAEGSGDAAGAARLLGARPLHRIVQSGARVVESLRQVALRVAPLERVLDPSQRAVVRSLRHPRLTIGAGGDPEIVLLPGEHLPESAGITTAADLLRAIAQWTEVARAMGLDRTEHALRDVVSVEALLERLALGAVLYARIEPGLAEEGDRRRFTERYRTPGTSAPAPEAVEGLRRIVTDWSRSHGIGPEAVLPMFESALERVCDDADRLPPARGS